MKIQLIFLGLLIVLISCNENQSKPPDVTNIDTLNLKSNVVNNDSVILKLTRQILISIKEKNYFKFIEYAHPLHGIRFSPYGYIDTISDIKLTSEEIIDKIKNQKKIIWGYFDGSDNKIQLSINEYFKQFVYNADFLNAEKRSVNKMIGYGNSLNNLESIYSDCNYSESYFSGFDKKYEGMDWCCLRLVFINYKNKFYLVGIIHDQWTI